MRRRTLLSTLASVTALSGCAGIDSPGSGPETEHASQTATQTDTETPTPSATPDPPDDEPRSYTSLADMETVGQTCALSPTRYRSSDDAEVWVGSLSRRRRTIRRPSRRPLETTPRRD